MKKIIAIGLAFLMFGLPIGFAQDDTSGSSVDASGAQVNQESQAQEPSSTQELKTSICKAKTACCCEDDDEDYGLTFYEKSTARPFQIQLAFTGGAMSPNDGYGPGIGLHVGYFLTEKLYLGVTSSAFVDWDNGRERGHSDKKYYDDEKIYGQKGGDVDDSSVAAKHIATVRYMPWNLGVFFSAGILLDGKEDYTVKFNEQERELNGNTYTTGLEATVEYKQVVVPTIGFGYNHIFENGISLSFELSGALADPQTPDVEVAAVNSAATVSETDLDYWADQIKDNEKRYSAHAVFGVGYNF